MPPVSTKYLEPPPIPASLAAEIDSVLDGARKDISRDVERQFVGQVARIPISGGDKWVDKYLEETPNSPSLPPKRERREREFALFVGGPLDGEIRPVNGRYVAFAYPRKIARLSEAGPLADAGSTRYGRYRFRPTEGGGEVVGVYEVVS